MPLEKNNPMSEHPEKDHDPRKIAPEDLLSEQENYDHTKKILEMLAEKREQDEIIRYTKLAEQAGMSVEDFKKAFGDEALSAC